MSIGACCKLKAFLLIALLNATVLTAAFSPDGEHLVAGDKHGRLAVCSLDPYLSAEYWESQKVGEEQLPPQRLFAAHKGSISALQFVQAGGLLVSAGEDGLQVWDWAQLRGAGAEGRVEPVARLRGGAAEVNALALDAARQQLWAGLGDGALQLWDLPTRRLLAQQETAHVDAVLALAFRAYTSQLFSAGEDGLLRVWDVRAPPAQPLRVLDPLTGAAPASSARRSRGGWLGALELDASGEWLACGGGARVASVLHAGSLACTALLPCAGAVHALCFDAEARLLAAGAFSALQVFTRDGRLYSLVPTQLPATFTLALNVASPRRRLLALAGLAPRIDLYAPPDYATRHSAFVLTPPRPAP